MAVKYKKSEVNTSLANYNPETDTYETKYTLPEVTVSGTKPKKPYWVSARTTLLQPSEFMYPFSLVGTAIDNIDYLSPTLTAINYVTNDGKPTVGPAFNKYVSPTLSLGNWIVGAGNPYEGAEKRANNEGLLGAFLPFDFLGPKVIKASGVGFGRGIGRVVTSERPGLVKLADKTFSKFADNVETTGDYRAPEGILPLKLEPLYDRFAPKTNRIIYDVKTGRFQLTPQAKLWRDRLFHTQEYANARLNGLYPLTFAERRQYMSTLKDDFQGTRNKLLLRRTNDYNLRNLESISPEEYNTNLGNIEETQKVAHISKEGDAYTSVHNVYGYSGGKKGLKHAQIVTRGSNSLLPKQDRLGFQRTGAHETDHTILKFDTYLKNTMKVENGKRVLNRNSDFNFLEKHYGKWEGSPHELMSVIEGELEGKTKSYRDLTPSEKFNIADHVNHKFKLNMDIFELESKLQNLSENGYFKHGGGINIKKENKGKFTDYCGGKVTQECIAKGKKSSNPTIRKRATFAANARKWKHQTGGIIKAQEGTKTNFWLKAGNFLNSDAGKNMVGALTNLASTAVQNKKVSSEAEMSKASVDMQTEETKKLSMIQGRLLGIELLQLMADSDNPNATGGIFPDWFVNKCANLNLQAIELEGENKKAMIDALAQRTKSENISNSLQSIVQTGVQVLGSANKKSTPTASPTVSKDNISSDVYKIDSFWNKPQLSTNLFATKYTF